MKNFLFFLLPFSFSVSVNAQENIPSKWIGIQMHSFLGEASDIGYEISFAASGGETLTYSLNHQNLLNTGIFLRNEMQNNWFLEYGLVALNVQKNKDVTFVMEVDNAFFPASGGTRSSQEIVLRAEAGKWLNDGGEKKMRFGIGASIDPFGSFHQVLPATSYGFPFKSQRIGAEVRFIPRVAYQISSRFIVEIKLPVRVYTVVAERTELDDPRAPEENRIQSDFTNQFNIGALQGAIGLSVKL